MKRSPVILEWLLSCFLRYDDHESVLGDFEERYLRIVQKKGLFFGFFWYLFQTVFSLPFFLKNTIIWNMIMFKNYLKTAFRNIRKHKGFSTINILGLALGMAVCLFMIKFIVFLNSFDSFHENSDRIYTITTSRISSSGNIRNFAQTPSQLVSVLRNECPAVEETAVLTSRMGTSWASHNNKTLPADITFVDQGFIDIFTSTIISGKSETLLTEPNSIVITDRAAEKFFGSENPIGKILHCGHIGEMTVTGVIAEFPHNSKFHEFEILISYPTLISNKREQNSNTAEGWSNINTFSYILLSDNASVSTVNSALSRISNLHINDGSYTFSFSPLPVGQLVFQTDLPDNFSFVFPPYMLYIMELCALCILLIACFNYANLSIAKAFSRLKEIGMRKVIGAQRIQLFIQFIAESVIQALLALFAAVYFHKIIIYLFISMHPQMAEMFKFEDTPTVYIFFFLFAVITGIISGLLPALYLSRLRPIDILSKFSRFKIISKISIRKILIGFQLAVSFLFLIMTISSLKQFNYAQQFDFGFETANIVNVRLSPDQNEKYRNAISGNIQIREISASGHIPGTNRSSSLMVRKANSADSMRIGYLPADKYFIDNFGLTLIAGENFPETTNRNKESFILINETAVERFGFENPAGAIGQQIYIGKNEVSVLGVVRDFTYERYYSPIRPLAIRYLPEKHYYVNIRISAYDKNSSIKYLEKRWNQLFPNTLFSYQFYEDSIEKTYLLSKILMLFGGFVSVLAIAVACLGLLGISIYNVETKTKEIGVRKILGAGIINIIGTFSKEFVFIIFVSSVIIAPIAWFLNNLALQDVTNRAVLGIGDICLGILIMFVIGLLTNIAQIIKAVRVRPVDCLRYE